MLATWILLIIMALSACPGVADEYFEDFNDGLAQGWGQPAGWPPALKPIDGSKGSQFNYIVNNVHLHTQPRLKAGGWCLWKPAQDGGLRTASSDPVSGEQWAWHTNKFGFGIYEMEIGFEPHIGAEKRTKIVLFGSHNTQNTHASLKSGLVLSLGRTEPTGALLQAVPGGSNGPAEWVTLADGSGHKKKPIFDGADPNNIQLKISIKPDYTLDVWWCSVGEPWRVLWKDVDVSSYLIELSGDVISGFKLVGRATEGYWGIGSSDSGFHRYDNLSFVPHHAKDDKK